MLQAAGRATTFPTTTTQGDSVCSLSPNSCWTPPSVHTQLACEVRPASLTMHTCGGQQQTCQQAVTQQTAQPMENPANVIHLAKCVGAGTNQTSQLRCCPSQTAAEAKLLDMLLPLWAASLVCLQATLSAVAAVQ